MRERMSGFVKLLQLEIVDALSSLEEVQTFRWDHWKRESDGGYGTSCVLQGGLVFEKAGVNISNVQGHLPPGAIRQMRDRLDCDRFSWWDGKSHLPFFASGISLVIHPSNPNAPTVHLNYRYFEIDDPIDESNQVWWFGGGSDLTPSYLFEEDCIQFHRSLKDACDRHDRGYYQKFKEWCDRYFYIPHRDETRGIGGIFFDDQSGKEASDDDRENLFGFVRDLGKSFVPTYLSILERRRSMNYCDRQKLWQQLRRGRYVEFNLIYDRGTKFGLATPGARIESILMSLPLTARWEYMTSLSPLKNSSSSEPQRDRADSDCLGERDLEGEEENLLKVLKRPKDWV
ncbi:Coproporphyrinogen III oxidase [Phakopsora pachyrhizi]|uniref:coproporphyrinogen oxidase n=1 Tax=Phakopsora pachyrhizi TaxID=170000 RepID=A0AAV0AH13_PHAPC|nr:Coproporphyrinogen III oxidase [Phakopsora pachyrhizi]CAH7665944.1 Coproporphyrinogen III oxidase [Phakopsora pachyrhizi]